MINFKARIKKKTYADTICTPQFTIRTFISLAIIGLDY